MRLPNVGINNAKKISIHLMNNKELLNTIIESMKKAYEQVQICEQCRGFSVSKVCEICTSNRQKHTLCIVKNHIDMHAIENTLTYKGLYYILGEDFSPSQPKHIIEGVEKIIKTNQCKEVILAFSPSIEGSILLQYMKIVLEKYSVSLTHLSIGIPLNTDIDAVGMDTLQIALQNRKICN